MESPKKPRALIEKLAILREKTAILEAENDKLKRENQRLRESMEVSGHDYTPNAAGISILAALEEQELTTEQLTSLPSLDAKAVKYHVSGLEQIGYIHSRYNRLRKIKTCSITDEGRVYIRHKTRNLAGNE